MAMASFSGGGEFSLSSFPKSWKSATAILFLSLFVVVLDPLPEIMREKLTLMRETDLKIQAEFVQLEEDVSQFLSEYRRYQQQSSLSPSRSKINVHRSTSN